MENNCEQIHQEADKWNSRAFRNDVTSHELEDHYREGAVEGTYEKYHNPELYRGPNIAVSVLTRHITDKSAQILDLGAGTGYVAINLRDRGFPNVDALEPSLHMLQVAKERKLYRNYFNEPVTDQPTSLQSESYDVLISCGSFGDGHIPMSGLKEFIRLVKPGGIICIAMRRAFLVEAYSGALEPYMHQIELDGAWRNVERSFHDNYSYGNEGVALVYRVPGPSSG